MPTFTFWQLVAITAIVGFLLWVLGRITVLDATIKQILYWGAIIIVVVLWILFVLQLVGLN